MLVMMGSRNKLTGVLLTAGIAVILMAGLVLTATMQYSRVQHSSAPPSRSLRESNGAMPGPRKERPDMHKENADLRKENLDLQKENSDLRKENSELRRALQSCTEPVKVMTAAKDRSRKWTATEGERRAAMYMSSQFLKHHRYMSRAHTECVHKRYFNPQRVVCMLACARRIDGICSVSMCAPGIRKLAHVFVARGDQLVPRANSSRLRP